LSVPVTAESFQMVSGRNAQIVNALGVVQHPQLASCHRLNLVGQHPRLSKYSAFDEFQLPGFWLTRNVTTYLIFNPFTLRPFGEAQGRPGKVDP